MKIANGTANIHGSVIMAADGTRIAMTITLYCDGKVIKSWSSPTSTTSSKSVIEQNFKLSQKGTYQVKTKYTVYSNSSSESGTSSSLKVKY